MTNQTNPYSIIHGGADVGATGLYYNGRLVVDAFALDKMGLRPSDLCGFSTGMLTVIHCEAVCADPRDAQPTD